MTTTVTLVEGVTADVQAIDNTFRPGRGPRSRRHRGGLDATTVATSTTCCPSKASDWGVEADAFAPGDEYTPPLHRAGHLRLLLLAARHQDQGHGRHHRGDRLIDPPREDRRTDSRSLAPSSPPLATVALLQRRPAATMESSSDHRRRRRGVRRHHQRPRDHATIQEAVDAAKPGDLILIAPGTYNEAVDVETENLTIRGLDRNEVILDGEFELENGIRVLGRRRRRREHDGPQLHRPTASSGPASPATGARTSPPTATATTASTPSTRSRASSTTRTRSGSPDAGFYIGAVLPVRRRHRPTSSPSTTASATRAPTRAATCSSSTRRSDNNRAGIVPNTGSYELCYPERETTIVGNIVYDNNQADTPAIGAAIDRHGQRHHPAGRRQQPRRAEPRLRPRASAASSLVPFPETNANDLPPDRVDLGRALRRDQGRPAHHRRDPRDDLLAADRQHDHRQRRQRLAAWATWPSAPSAPTWSTLRQLLLRQHRSRPRPRPTSRRWPRARASPPRATGWTSAVRNLLGAARQRASPPSVDYETRRRPSRRRSRTCPTPTRRRPVRPPTCR